MIHLIEDIQFCLVLAGGGSLTALAISRVKYGNDWVDPWFAMTKAVSALALAVVVFNERAMIYAWWAAAPFLVSMSLGSTFAWGVAQWALRRKTEDKVLSLELRGDLKESTNRGIYSRMLFYWGMASLFLLLFSIIVAATPFLR
jgi:hypothetical protein